MEIFDLTHKIEPGMPVYPGDPPVCACLHADYPENGFRVHRVELGTHAGTHVDAPAHFHPDGPTVDDLPLDALIGPAHVLDLHDGEATLPTGATRVLLRSGWGAQWSTPRYFSGFPGLQLEWATRLVDAGVRLVGVETPSLHPDWDTDAALHRLLLGAGVVIIENLAPLEPLPEQVWLTALPLPFAGLDGAPCRVIASGSLCLEAVAAESEATSEP